MIDFLESIRIIDQDLNMLISYEELINYEDADESIAKEFWNFMGKDTSEELHADDVYENYVVYERNAYENLKYHWQNAWNKGPGSYSSHLAGVIGDFAAWEVLGVSSSDELTELFKLIDKNSDGVIDGTEACRYYVADYDFICEKFDHKPTWMAHLDYWE